MYQGDIFMIEYKEEKKRLFFMGSELVSFCVKYPQTEGKENINSLFDTLASSSISWATNELFDLAKDEYENGLRSGGFPLQKPYRYTLQMLADEVGDDYRITLSARLCRGGEEVERYGEELVLDAQNGFIKRKR